MRTQILTAIGEANARPGPGGARREPAPYPDYDPADLVSAACLGEGTPWEIFSRNLAAVNGHAFDRVEDLVAFLQEKGARRGYCDPALGEAVGRALGEHFEVTDTFEPAPEAIDTYDFGVTRAAAMVAESGTVVLTDATTSRRLAALAPWIHVACATPDQLLRTLPEAVEQLADETDPNVIWVTGPSKTADVEGILIEGVHGPGEQVCLMVGEA